MANCRGKNLMVKLIYLKIYSKKTYSSFIAVWHCETSVLYICTYVIWKRYFRLPLPVSKTKWINYLYSYLTIEIKALKMEISKENEEFTPIFNVAVHIIKRLLVWTWAVKKVPGSWYWDLFGSLLDPHSFFLPSLRFGSYFQLSNKRQGWLKKLLYEIKCCITRAVMMGGLIDKLIMRKLTG